MLFMLVGDKIYLDSTKIILNFRIIPVIGILIKYLE